MNEDESIIRDIFAAAIIQGRIPSLTEYKFDDERIYLSKDDVLKLLERFD